MLYSSLVLGLVFLIPLVTVNAQKLYEERDYIVVGFGCG